MTLQRILFASETYRGIFRPFGLQHHAKQGDLVDPEHSCNGDKLGNVEPPLTQFQVAERRL